MIRKIQKRAQKMPDFGIDDLLGMFGLERRRNMFASAMPVAFGLTVGVLAGAGVALLFAPRPGKELRADIQKKLVDMKEHTLPQLVDHAFEQARAAGIDIPQKNMQSRPHNSIAG